MVIKATFTKEEIEKLAKSRRNDIRKEQCNILETYDDEYGVC